MNHHALIATQKWVKQTVIGLNLCPFAAPIFPDSIRFHVAETSSIQELLTVLAAEARMLANADESTQATTLIIAPSVCEDFESYLDALDLAHAVLEKIGLEGVLQIASFHPQYQFADSSEEDPANYTNRSPYPLFHLLRESSVTDAVDRYPDTLAIPEENVKKLRELGKEAMMKRLSQCHEPHS